eukprot:c20446_g1_i1.p1 GENE.c20446_g1_i1~~c20446_g1_i1.p1  ORF type:complete len:192 (+),score=53.65 c20446_g1_i1:29-604(+)
MLARSAVQNATRLASRGSPIPPLCATTAIRAMTAHHATGHSDSNEDKGFIAKIAREGTAALLGKFFSGGRFDHALSDVGMTCTHASDGVAIAELKVDKSLANAYDTLHGGAISLLIDVLGTMALLTLDHKRAGVSVEMSSTFCAAAKIGDEIVVTGKVLKYGRRLGFTQVDITRKADGVLLATGRHTKALS